MCACRPSQGASSRRWPISTGGWRKFQARQQPSGLSSLPKLPGTLPPGRPATHRPSAREANYHLRWMGRLVDFAAATPGLADAPWGRATELQAAA